MHLGSPFRPVASPTPYAVAQSPVPPDTPTGKPVPALAPLRPVVVQSVSPWLGVVWDELKPRPRARRPQLRMPAPAVASPRAAAAAGLVAGGSVAASASAAAAAPAQPLSKGEQRKAHRARVRQTSRVSGVALWTSPFAVKHEQIKKLLVRNRDVFPIAAMQLAAVAIQRLWRGHRARAGLQDTLHTLWNGKDKPATAATATGAAASGASGASSAAAAATASTGAAAASSSSSQAQGQPLTAEQKAAASAAAQTNLYLRFVSENKGVLESAASDAQLFGAFQEWCAVRVQRAWRHARIARHARYKLYALVYGRAAFSLARAWRVRARRRWEYHNRAGQRHHGAVAIQRAWRAFNARRIYRYFRDLIVERQRSNPVLLLKALNPREAQLMDGASGLYVRFRLSGPLFPPVIVYKVFTSHAVTDVNAFAPRDYTRAGAAGGKLKPGGAQGPIHLRDEKKRSPDRPTRSPRRAAGSGAAAAAALSGGGGSSGSSGSSGGDGGRTGWYRRWENNGWRPVSEKLLAATEQDQLSAIAATQGMSSAVAAAKTIDYHCDKLVRQVDLLKKRKQKKLLWLKQMYTAAASANALAQAQAQAQVNATAHANTTAATTASPAPAVGSSDLKRAELAALAQTNPALHRLLTGAAANAGASPSKPSPNASTAAGGKGAHGPAAAAAAAVTSAQVVAATKAERTLKRLMRVDHQSDSMFDVDWEDEADDLLQWTQGLDFERYQDEWFLTATSRPADKFYRQIELDDIQRG